MKFLIRLFECIFKWKVEISNEQELADSQVIIAQSFGLQEYDDPGKSNMVLAKIVKDLHNQFQLPLVLQWEIADCLPEIFKKNVIREHREKGRYLDTFETVDQSRNICKQNYWDKAIVVAHPDHIWRVAETAKKMGFITRIADTKIVPYNSLSVQSWTRSRIKFLIREIPARIFYLLHGWI